MDGLFHRDVDSENDINDSEMLNDIFTTISRMRTEGDNDTVEQTSHWLSSKPTKLDTEALDVVEDTLPIMRTGIFDEKYEDNSEDEDVNTGNRSQNVHKQMDMFFSTNSHPTNTAGATTSDSMGNISPLFGSSSPSSRDFLGTHIVKALPSMPLSTESDAAKTSTPSLSSPGTTGTVYGSITDSPLHGRMLDFRAHLTRNATTPEMEAEAAAGVFVGQIPSTYTEDDIAALLRAIGADAGAAVDVRDVKSHNQSRTCAFVLVNHSALPALLAYSKRVLCDGPCVWVVDGAQAGGLKAYINAFPRDRLRGVPKAALVLEVLTPFARNRGAKGARREEALMASAPGVALPRWGAVGQTAVPVPAFYGAPAMYAVRPAIGAPLVHVGAPSLGVCAPNAPPYGPEHRCGCGRVLLLGGCGEWGQCAQCGAALGASDLAYTCPQGHTALCLRCFGPALVEGQRAAANTSGVQQVSYINTAQLAQGGNPTFIQAMQGIPQLMPFMMPY